MFDDLKGVDPATISEQDKQEQLKRILSIENKIKERRAGKKQKKLSSDITETARKKALEELSEIRSLLEAEQESIVQAEDAASKRFEEERLFQEQEQIELDRKIAERKNINPIVKDVVFKTLTENSFP